MVTKKKTEMKEVGSGDMFLIGITFILVVDLTLRSLFFLIGPVIRWVAMWILKRKYRIDPSEGTSGGGNFIFPLLSFIPLVPVTYLEAMIYKHEYNAAARRMKDKEDTEQKGQERKEECSYGYYLYTFYI